MVSTRKVVACAVRGPGWLLLASAFSSRSQSYDNANGCAQDSALDLIEHGCAIAVTSYQSSDPCQGNRASSLLA